LGAVGGTDRESRHASLTLVFFVSLVACDAPAAKLDGGRRDLHVITAAEAGYVLVDAGVEDAGDEDADASIDIDAMSARGMTMIEEIATIIHANEDNCDAMGAKVDAYYKDNQASIDDMHETYGKMARDARKVLQTRYRARFDTAWKKLQPGLKKCKDEPKIKALVVKGD
jgi:hypothetical protein